MDISPITSIDLWLDAEVDKHYRDQPLAQDWARVAKLSEEIGEAIAELILLTGQNPRKAHDPYAYERLLKELSDCVWTGVAAIQHFTKDADHTDKILDSRGQALLDRVPEKYK